MGFRTYAIIFLIVSIFAYAIYNLVTFLDFNGQYVEINTDSCVKIKGIIGAEDMTRVGQFLIASSNDNLKDIFFPDKNDRGAIYVINPDTESFRKLKLINFPKEIGFRPHGISYKDGFLYVINHAFSQGGERVEVFKHPTHDSSSPDLSYDGMELEYRYSIPFDDYHLGRLNDLTVTNTDEHNDEIYITHSSPVTDSKEGRDVSLLGKIKNLFFIAFKIKNTYVYYCKGINESGKAKCKAILGTQAEMNNGINYNSKKDYIYVAKTVDKKLTTYKIDEKDRSVLHLIKEIDLRFYPDNIDFNEEDHSLTIGVFNRGIDFLNWLDLYEKNKHIVSNFTYWGGAISVNIFTYKTKTIIMQKDKLAATSVGVQVGKKIVLGSFSDDGILFCYIN